MTTISKLSEKDYINVSFVILFQIRVIKFFFFIIIASTLYSILNIKQLNDGAWNISLVSILFPIVILVSTYYGCKRNYKNNKRISEQIKYEFGTSVLRMTGESFDTTLTWNKVPKVTLTKNWLLVWQNNALANVIPRKDMKEEMLTELKSILDNNEVKNNL